MLKRLGEKPDLTQTTVSVGEASYPAPFETGLEYAAPARGVWNIVHTGMLVPESHEIFICAAGCLRGVVLTAAEMGAAERFSTVAIRENNVLDGDMEELMIEGVTDILNKLQRTPRAVLVYTSCIHHFMSCDVTRCYAELRRRFPNVDFTDCYMDPIMRKSGLTPDQTMRSRLYSLLKPAPVDGMSVNIIGSDLQTYPDCELVQMVQQSGRTLREITACKSYDEYQLMATSYLNIAMYPAAKAGCEALCERLAHRCLYLPFIPDYDDIDRELELLAAALETNPPDASALRALADESLFKARAIVGDAPVAIDYTALSHPMELARLLINHGFNVTDLFLDSISTADRDAFLWLKRNYPSLRLHPTIHPEMRVYPRDERNTLAIGQKAAYFCGTCRFVNIVEDGGLHGYMGIIRLAELITDAFENPKDAKIEIQPKGLGCAGGCCL